MRSYGYHSFYGLSYILISPPRHNTYSFRRLLSSSDQFSEVKVDSISQQVTAFRDCGWAGLLTVPPACALTHAKITQIIAAMNALSSC